MDQLHLAFLKENLRMKANSMRKAVVDFFFFLWSFLIFLAAERKEVFPCEIS